VMNSDPPRSSLPQRRSASETPPPQTFQAVRGVAHDNDPDREIRHPLALRLRACCRPEFRNERCAPRCVARLPAIMTHSAHPVHPTLFVVILAAACRIADSATGGGCFPYRRSSSPHKRRRRFRFGNGMRGERLNPANHGSLPHAQFHVEQWVIVAPSSSPGCSSAGFFRAVVSSGKQQRYNRKCRAALIRENLTRRTGANRQPGALWRNARTGALNRATSIMTAWSP
jgi:hypothetical protein